MVNDVTPPLRVRRARARQTGRLLAGGICAGAMALSAVAATYASVNTVPAPSTHTVRSGDSVWSIAAKAAPASDLRPYVDAIIRINHLGNVRIDPGEVLSLPDPAGGP